MQEALRWFISSPKYRLENLYVFNWESDLLFLTPSGYWYEIEIKVSRSDFFNDANKMARGRRKSEVLADPNSIGPNYFYYAVPKDLITLDEIPDHAGLIEVDLTWSEVKKAPRLKGKIELNQARLADKFYYNWKNEKVAHKNTRRDIERLKKKYSDTDALLNEEVNKAVSEERYRAVYAFKSACPHFSNYRLRCEREGRESARCGWCDEIKEFEKTIYREA